jgi:tripartite-type tricarboxylate transporter receptor subunit TctC
VVDQQRGCLTEHRPTAIPAVAMPEIPRRITELGAVPRTSTSDEFRTRVAREIAQFKQVVEARKIPLQ